MSDSDETQEGFCGRCGAKNPLKSTFCFKCGEKLLWASDRSPELEAPIIVEDKPTEIIPLLSADTQYVSQSEMEREPNPRQGIWILICTFGVVLVVLWGTINASKSATPGDVTPGLSIKEQVIARQKAEAAKHPKPTKAQLKAQAERQKQIAFQRKQAEIAQKKAEANAEASRVRTQKKRIDKYTALINLFNEKYGFQMVNYFQVDGDGRQVTITVDDAWHSLPKQVRLENAQTLGEFWANILPKGETPGFKIIDMNGNRVGGYNGWSGIWVQD